MINDRIYYNLHGTGTTEKCYRNTPLLGVKHPFPDCKY